MGSLLKSTFAVSLMTLLSRVLGLARDIVIARFYSAGVEADAFFVAFKIPNFLRRLFAEGGPDRAVIGVDEIEGRYLANQMAAGAGDDRVIRVSAGRKLAGPGWSVQARKGFLTEWRKGKQVGVIDLRDLVDFALVIGFWLLANTIVLEMRKAD